MKLLIISTLTIVCALAEPPVENRYLPPQQGGGAPSQAYRAPSRTYGVPNLGSQRQTDAIFRGRQSSSSQSRRPSSQYGAPSGQFASPSTQYGAPSGQFATPSTQYGAPSGQFATPSTQYGAPSGQFATPSTQYGAPSGQFAAPSTQYGAPSGQFTAPSTQYGVPSGQFGAPSMQYGVPSANAPSALNGAPGVGGPSQQHGTPGFGSGAGSSRGAQQSRQYLPPGSGRESYDGEEGNGEPANYSFEYMVKDEPSGNDFGHREARQGDRTEGLYYVLLPDGRKQTVEYEADHEGYKPRISYEDTGAGLSGYGRNGQAYHGQGGPY